MRAVALSFACNNACIFCAQGKLRATNEIDPEAAIAEALRELAPGETVLLQGGEPTLLERLPEWIRALDQAGAGRVAVQTNGRRLAYRTYARALREASSKLSLDVSLAGSTEAMHDYHTGAPGSFKQTVVGLRNARDEGLRASLSATVTRSSFRHLAEIVRLAHAVRAAGIRFTLAQAAGTARDIRDRVVPAPELVTPYLALAVAEGKKLGVEVLASATGAPEQTAVSLFAGLGEVEAVPGAARDGQRRSLAIFGRPAPARREERTSARKSGDDLKAIFPTLFEGAAPRDVAEVVAAEKGAS